MAIRIVVIHDEYKFFEQVPTALRRAGYSVAAFADPSSALDDLKIVRHAELLITRVDFGPRILNGITMAVIVRTVYPEIKVMFTARPEFTLRALQLGEFMALPVDVPVLVEAVKRLLTPSDTHPINLSPGELLGCVGRRYAAV
jgi:DNA-binding response OmpR family regulator